MIKFTIYGRLPNLNDYTDANRSRKWYQGAKMKKEAQEACEWAIKQQCKGQTIDKCFVEIKWIEKNLMRDPDNIACAKKFILDALVNQKVLKDDRHAQILGFFETFPVDKINPRIEVTLHDEAPSIWFEGQNEQNS